MVNTEKILNEVIKKFNIIDAVDIPSIDLYMDQVTTFMDKHLSESKRFPDDKILTKTMINNYSKNDLLPPPVKKRYSKNHIILLILIYYYKNILSISDINTILTPLCDNYFNKNSSLSLEKIYAKSCELETEQIDSIRDDILKMIEDSKKQFTEVDEQDKEYLQLYSLITSLCFDVYIKKQMLEGIIDSMNSDMSKHTSKKKDLKKKAEKSTEHLK